MRVMFRGGHILTPDQTIEDSALVVENGKVSAIEPERQISENPVDVQVIDASGTLVAPGLIDVHVHGSMGSDVMDATQEALYQMENFFLKQGVTAYLPTTLTASPEAITLAIETVSSRGSTSAGAVPLGVHLEGPYVSHAYRGAQPVQWLRNPDPEEYRAWFSTGLIRLVTLAPELPGAAEMIEEGTRQGVRFSAGHTEATFEEMRRAADAGLSQATHTFNGMVGLHHREPGTVGAILLDDRITAEVIADGIHLHPAVIGLILRAKGIDRTVLVTDAMRATGLEDGDYQLGDQIVHVKAGIARTAAGGLAGSTLTLNRAIRNTVQYAREYAGLTVNQVLTMATRTPARLLGLEGKKGTLAPGSDADVVLFDSQFQVKSVMVAGKIVLQ